MSAELVGRALKVQDLSPTEKLVLVGLADCTNTATGKCFPAAPFLAKVALCSIRHIPRCVAALEDQGLVSVDRRPGRSSLYTVFPTPDIRSAPPLTSGQDTPDIPLTQLRQDTSDTAMSDEPERTMNQERAREDNVVDISHHYCRPNSEMREGPKQDCTDCGPRNEQGEMQL